jgi:hypothetical protein
VYHPQIQKIEHQKANQSTEDWRKKSGIDAVKKKRNAGFTKKRENDGRMINMKTKD